MRRIVEPQYPDATYVGRACYIRLDDMKRAKLQFITEGISGNYSALKMTILNRDEGIVDIEVLRFEDLWGKKQVSNPNFRDGISPHIWDDYGKFSWYVYHPNDSDYQLFTQAVGAYLDVFQEQASTDAPQWQQTM